MKGKDIQVGKTYAAKVSKNVVRLLVLAVDESFATSINGRDQWRCRNTVTGREGQK